MNTYGGWRNEPLIIAPASNFKPQQQQIFKKTLNPVNKRLVGPRASLGTFPAVSWSMFSLFSSLQPGDYTGYNPPALNKR
jgi:hypothetical protein